MTAIQKVIECGFVLAALSSLGLGQTASPKPSDLMKKVAEKFGAAKEYSLEGTLEVGSKKGVDADRVIVDRAKVKLAVAPGGKYRLQVDRESKPSYVLVSDGQTSWAYMANLKRYTQRAGAAPIADNDPMETFGRPSSSSQDLAADFVRSVVPILANLDKPAEFTDLRGALLTVMSKKDQLDRQEMTYLTLDPATLLIRKMAWMLSLPAAGSDKAVMRFDLAFSSFQTDQSIPDQEFHFAPPARVKKVSSLPVPSLEKK